MKLESQVCSLELAKKLKELGVKQDSLFYWAEDEGFVVIKEKIENSDDWKNGYFHSAFTVAEFGEMLPRMIIGAIVKYHHLSEDLYSVTYEPIAYKAQRFQANADTEANARAKMLIHLIEKGIVKP